MAFSQSLNPNVFEKHNRVLYLPESWNRLMSLIKYQVPNGGFALMEGQFGAGKSSFGKIFEKKLVVDDAIDCQLIQVHPLSTIQQIKAQLPKQLDKPLLVIIDDAHEASTLLLQKLTVPTENVYWLLLAEPGLGDRVESFSERCVDLPLFSKEDCFEFLQKQLQDQPKFAQVSQMQSDTIWYSSEGLPKDIVENAKKNLSSLFSGQESNENFERANKSWYMTVALGAAAVVFIILLVVNIASEDDEQVTGSNPQELVIEKAQDASTDNANITVSEDVAAEIQGAEQANRDLSDEDNNVNPSDIEQSVGEDSKLSEEEVAAAAATPDPIEDIALKVAEKPDPESVTADVNQDFKQWLSSQSQDAYSLQLFSHSDEQAARAFQSSLDLADSYVYAADIDGKQRYRVLWGAFPTRAEAEQSIEALPPEILAQKPWVRQLSSIVNELSKGGEEL
ncbi:SPOR domain-containing protein [Kangiella shandongensis]|uniref:SPOR domain-containing protein n=1 Tax=Kangiella shandongensis TaxID=2763258 RepID=UPI001CBAD0D1|nr:SPOR domain-containing protein [Kangiella shandongensis]